MKVFEGYTTYPMERMTYDPDIDFETREPNGEDLIKDTMNCDRKGVHKTEYKGCE